MNSTLSTLLFLVITISASAQDLSGKISEKAFAVFSINGGLTLEKVSEVEINKSLLFHEVIREFFRGDDEILSLEEFGVNLRDRMYFVAERGDDVNYYYLTYNIAKLSTFERTIKDKIAYEKFVQKDGYNIVFYDYNSALYWNNETAILITADYVGQEYAYNYWEDYGYNEYAYEESVEMAVEVPLEEMSEEEWKEYMRKTKEQAEKEEKERQLAEEERERKRAEKQRLLEEKVSNELSKRALLFFTDDLKNQNKQFKNKLNDEADASFWYANNFSMLDLFFGLRYPYGYGYYNPYNDLLSLGNFFGGQIACDLFLRETSINLDAKITYSDKLTADYSNILSQKIDKKFTNYLSSSDVGYISSSYSTEDLLNAYPNIIENMMLRYDTTFSDEYSIIADLFNLIVDEEAVANAVTGDALFIFNGIATKEVEHYYYDYDENYNYERKMEKRMELVPDFTFLVGSKESDLIQKVFKIALKHEGIETVGKGYKLIDKHHDFPFELYFAYHDEIVLFSTSVTKLDEFIKGGTNSKISSDHIKNITKNSGALYLDLNALLTGLLETDLRKSEKRVFTEMRNNLSTVSAQMKSKGGATLVNAALPVPSTEPNGAIYLLHFIDNVMKAEKNRN